MKFLDTEHKKKSAGITAIILLLLLFAVFNLGMKYLDPPIEYGVSINFGNSDVGSGEPVENTLKETVQEEIAEEVVEDEVLEEQVDEAVEEVIEENIVTDDTVEEAPVIKKTEEKKEVIKEQPKKETPKKKIVKEAPKKEVPKEEPKPPKPSKEITNALNSLLNGTSNSGSSQGEGDDSVKGVKGDKDGDANSNKYYGKTGNGSGGNYNLSGRKALEKPIEKPNCQEEGRVVVDIQVNQSGKVIKAEQGRGTTNSTPCLVDAAVKAALKTKWNPDSKAPSTQKGTIIYNFSLSQ